ncbi:hypothetical protein EG327_003165 [Venturia inaequalis]|uniref:Uncharacterized protein n=1 Tax=Venturia inaequalis TaxID=5025 RepID=A0A8H3VF87_VENIN|nr:hypothetical protein EG327_003165 [Venturia inaequalis]
MASLLSLPTELQLQILSYIVNSLDEAPSERNFDKEPSIHLVRSSQHILKDLSLACSELRQLVLPALFEYVCINVDYGFRTNKFLEPIATVGSFTLQRWDSEQQFRSDLYNTIEGFIDFLDNRGLQSSVKSLVICTTTDILPEWPHSVQQVPSMAKLWGLIFENLGPTRLVLAVPPDTMFTLLSTRVLDPKYHSRPPSDTPIQYLGLECENGETIVIDKESAGLRSETLWKCRPWTHFAFNAGGLHMYRLGKIVKQNQPERKLLLLRLQLTERDHSPLLLQIFGDLGEQLNNGCNIQNLHFISSFPDRQFFDRIFQQKGLEKIRHWRTKLAQPGLFEEMKKTEEMEKTGSSLLTATLLEYWNHLHHQLHRRLLEPLSEKGRGGTWLSSDKLNGRAWGFLNGEFCLEPARTFPPGIPALDIVHDFVYDRAYKPYRDHREKKKALHASPDDAMSDDGKGSIFDGVVKNRPNMPPGDGYLPGNAPYASSNGGGGGGSGGGRGADTERYESSSYGRQAADDGYSRDKYSDQYEELGDWGKGAVKGKGYAKGYKQPKSIGYGGQYDRGNNDASRSYENVTESEYWDRRRVARYQPQPRYREDSRERDRSRNTRRGRSRSWSGSDEGGGTHDGHWDGDDNTPAKKWGATIAGAAIGGFTGHKAKKEGFIGTAIGAIVGGLYIYR